MKILLKIFISFFALSLFSTANAVTIKWLHLYADSAPEMPSILKAVEEYEEKSQT